MIQSRASARHERWRVAVENPLPNPCAPVGARAERTPTLTCWSRDRGIWASCRRAGGRSPRLRRPDLPHRSTSRRQPSPMQMARSRWAGAPSGGVLRGEPSHPDGARRASPGERRQGTAVDQSGRPADRVCPRPGRRARHWEEPGGLSVGETEDLGVTACSVGRSCWARRQGRGERSPTVNAVIEHLCANPTHQIPEDVATPLVVHGDRWGYCPAGSVDGHDWRATGGKTLATVREWLGRPSAADSPVTARSGSSSPTR